MTTLTRLFIRNLSAIDCAYFDREHGLRGESWSVDAELLGTLDAEGMICDFGVVKRRLKTALDAWVDHKLLIAASDGCDISRQAGAVEVVFTDSHKRHLRYQAPEVAICELPLESITTTTLARTLAQRLHGELPANVQGLTIHLRNDSEPNRFHYCHGLSKHSGNCQRMGHGHRSSLEIEINGQRDAAAEAAWVERLSGRFIGVTADEIAGAPAGMRRFSYTANQGRFELELPGDACYVIDADATIECITDHICAMEARRRTGQRVQVTAFEGVGKGAIVTRQ